MTTAECVAVLKYTSKAVPKAVRSGMGKGLRYAAADAQSAFAQSSVGRGLLGHGDAQGPVGPFSKASKSLIRSSTRMLSNGTVIGKLTAYGLAALQELGGRTRPHVIKPRKADGVLHLEGFVHPFARFVNHPGSLIKPRPFLEAAFRRNQGRILAEIEKAIGLAFAKSVASDYRTAA